GTRIERSAAWAKDEISLKGVAAGLGANLPAALQLDGQPLAARAGLGAKLPTGRSDRACSLRDGTTIDRQIDCSGGQRTAERIDAGDLISAKDERSAVVVPVGDPQRSQTALNGTEPTDHVLIDVDDGIAQVLRGRIGVDLGAAILAENHVCTELN